VLAAFSCQGLGAAALDDAFDDLGQTAKAGAAPAQARRNSSEFGDALHPLWVALSRARAAIWKASLDKNESHFLNADYKVYEKRKDADGHQIGRAHV
jgi:hypothetical protein